MRQMWSACLWGLICLCGLLPAISSGQEPPSPERTKTIFLQKDASSPRQEPPPPARPEPLVDKSVKAAYGDLNAIYIPFSSLNSTFEKPDANVVVPYAEYRRMIEALRAGQAAQLIPAAVITQADYDIRIEGDLARIAARLKVNVLREGWAEVPVHFGSATIGSLKAGDNVLMRGGPEGRNVLLFPKAGAYEVELQLATTIHQSPEAREIAFDCPAVSLTTVHVTVPGKNQKIGIQPAGLRMPPQKNSDENTHATAQVGATGKISVKWWPPESQMPAMDLLASVNNRTLVTIADGLIHSEAFLDYDILRGELEQTRIVLPKSARLLDIFSNQGSLNWSAAEEGDNQIVTVKLSQPARKRLQITVRTESRLSESEFFVAGISSEKNALGIHALDAVRESGQIAIRHSADLTVNVIEQQALIRIENTEADPKLAGPNALLFKFYSPQIVLKLNSKPVEPRVQVEHLATFLFQEDELQFVNQLSYLLEHAGLFELTLQLPEKVQIDQVVCQQMKEFNVDTANRKLTISLRERTQGRMDVRIKGHIKLAATDPDTLKLPILEPLNVDREQGTVQVFAKESLEIQASQTGMESAQPLSIAQASLRNGLQLRAAWTFTRRPVTIPIRVVHKPTRLRANVGTLINIDPEQAHVTAKVTFRVEYAPLDEFTFSVPEAISKQLQIEIDSENNNSAPIKQRTAGTAENGRVIWTVQTQRKVLGRQTFVVTYDMSPSVGHAAPTDAAPADAATTQNATSETAGTNPDDQNYQFALVRPLGVMNAQGEMMTPLVEFRGEAVVTKDRTLAIGTHSNGNGVEQIDLRELTLLPETGTLAYRYFRDDQENPVSLSVKTSRFDIQDVVATAVSRALVEMVVSEDQSVTYRCRYLVKSTERQRLLIYLPKDLEVLGAFLDDREIKLEKAEVSVPGDLDQSLVPFWINVARAESSETPFLLTMQFLWNLKSGTNAHLLEESLLHLPLPVIGGGSRGVVQELKVVIWMPEEYALVGDPDPFLLQKRHRRFSFLLGQPTDHNTSHLAGWVTGGARSASVFAELPTEGRKAFVFTTLGSTSEITARVWNRNWMTLLLSATLVVIGWILLGTTWENKLGILLLMAFAAALYGLFDSHGLAQGMHAARYGLVVMLGMWLLRGLFRPGSPRSTGIPRDYTTSEIPYAVIPPPGVFERLQPDAGGTSS